MTRTKDVVEAARENGRFTMFTTALRSAGLEDILQARGPFTVFAPIDAAFGDLPEGTVEALLSSRPRLAIAITYHVIEGRMTADDIVRLDGARPRAINGHHLRIAHDEGDTFVNHARVVEPGIEASNGIIHGIDRVLLPWPHDYTMNYTMNPETNR
jgi:uncharacterized surface protein with fasciclin (FAS1) repeats